ncbi:MAG TPA: DUF4129 domain-containing protein, partial [Longimicrobium sp.]|nr:DUF4129 domain-containing protein [Longimicrobium sp.]
WIIQRIGSFFRWIADTFGLVRGLQGSAPVLFWVVVGLLAVTAVALLAHLLYSVTRGGGTTTVSPAAPAPVGEGPMTAAEWEEVARRAAGAGRLRDAALALYQALVLRLDARGALRFDTAKTPGDYRREIRAHPDAARPFATFLRGFEPVAFGGRSLDAAGYERLRAAAGEAGVRG